MIANCSEYCPFDVSCVDGGRECSRLQGVILEGESVPGYSGNTGGGESVPGYSG